MRGPQRGALQGVEGLAPQRQELGGLLVGPLGRAIRRPVQSGGGADLREEGALDLQRARRAPGRQVAAHPQIGVVGEGAQCADRVGEGEALGQGARPLRMLLDQGQQRRHGAGAQQARDRQVRGVGGDDVQAAPEARVGVRLVAGVDDGALAGGVERDLLLDVVGAREDLEAGREPIGADADPPGAADDLPGD